MPRRKLSEEIKNENSSLESKDFPDEMGKLADEWGDIKDQMATLQAREDLIKRRMLDKLKETSGEDILGSRFVVKYQTRSTVIHDDAAIIGVLKKEGKLQPIEVVETLNFDTLQDLIYRGDLALDKVRDFIGEKKSEFPVVRRLKRGV